MIDTFIRPPDWDPSQHEGGPLRMIKYYPDKATILKRFRLLPEQECLNDWFVRYIAEHSVRKLMKDGDGSLMILCLIAWKDCLVINFHLDALLYLFMVQIVYSC